MMVLAIGAAAAAGAVCRFLADHAVRRRVRSRVPLGVMVVNITGSFALGLIVGWGLYHGLADGSRAVLGTGFLGAYTTFSTHSYETVRLLEEGDHRAALHHNLASLGLGLLAASAGLALAAAL